MLKKNNYFCRGYSGLTWSYKLLIMYCTWENGWSCQHIAHSSFLYIPAMFFIVYRMDGHNIGRLAKYCQMLAMTLCMATSKNLCPNLVTKGSLVGNHIDDLAKDCSLSIANTLHVAVLHFSQICTNERHPIPHLYQQTMGCLSRVIHAKMTAMYWERMSYCFYSCRTIAAAANVICFVLVTDVK